MTVISLVVTDQEGTSLYDVFSDSLIKHKAFTQLTLLSTSNLILNLRNVC